MARSFPAQSMGQVSVLCYKATPVRGGKGTVRTHYNYTLDQAMRAGVLTLNDEGKITSVIDGDAKIELPDSLRAEDVFALDPAPKPEA